MSSIVITSLRVWQYFALPYYACLYGYHNWVIFVPICSCLVAAIWSSCFLKALLFWKGKGGSVGDIFGRWWYSSWSVAIWGGQIINLVKGVWGKLKFSSGCFRRDILKLHWDIFYQRTMCIFKSQQNRFMDSNPSRKESLYVYREMLTVVMFSIFDFHGHLNES